MTEHEQKLNKNKTEKKSFKVAHVKCSMRGTGDNCG